MNSNEQPQNIVDKSLDKEFSYGNPEKLDTDLSKQGSDQVWIGISIGIGFLALFTATQKVQMLFIGFMVLLATTLLIFVFNGKAHLALGVILGLFSPLLLVGACFGLMAGL